MKKGFSARRVPRKVGDDEEDASNDSIGGKAVSGKLRTILYAIESLV